MGHAAITLINHLGYAGLGIGLIISTLGLFSSELLLLLAGAAIRTGKMNLAAAFIIALIGQMTGGLLSHAIGHYGGTPLIERYGRYVLLSKHDLHRANRWFDRYGRIAAALGYCLPFLRGYIGYAAGIAGQPRSIFAASAFVGSAVWTVVMFTLGYYLAAHIVTIENLIRPFSYGLALIVVAAVVYFFWYRLQEQRA